MAPRTKPNRLHFNKPGTLRKACLRQYGNRENLTSEQILHGDSQKIGYRNLLQLLERMDPSDIVAQANRDRDEEDKISALLLRGRCRTALHKWASNSGAGASTKLGFLLNDRRERNRLEPLGTSWFPHNGSYTHELRQNLARMRERNPELVDPDQRAPWDPVDTSLPTAPYIDRWCDLSIYDGNRRKPPTAQQSHQGQPSQSQTPQSSNARARMVPEPAATAARPPLATAKTELPTTSFMTTLSGIAKKRPER
ncbi:hypothetical protein CERZMDRAFT_99190 [Cercospora zeae-maydis SCOH1-5]|uniref:Uncharacterized protein n=1 Tax=Cercospora zeae-maydis SCOH1-5 TaxID=717836 RepID=A0A6A6FB57_9PEZI|nr:hypothetical protein CERZMDRAFT_99190 [Cercospora zeae-maydis SCOH1-5]